MLRATVGRPLVNRSVAHRVRESPLQSPHPASLHDAHIAVHTHSSGRLSRLRGATAPAAFALLALSIREATTLAKGAGPVRTVPPCLPDRRRATHTDPSCTPLPASAAIWYGPARWTWRPRDRSHL